MTLDTLTIEQKQLIEEERDKFAVEFAKYCYRTSHIVILPDGSHEPLSARQLLERFKQERK